MEKITSFTIDHTKLKCGIYVSRKDTFSNQIITTYDIRLKRPNKGEYMSDTAAHTLEHMGATFFRNDPDLKNRCVYFGPMGCATGFYLLLSGEQSSKEISGKIREMFEFVLSHEGTVPGASEKECGNYRNLNLESAKILADEFLQKMNSFDDSNYNYPA